MTNGLPIMTAERYAQIRGRWPKLRKYEVGKQKY